MGLILNLHLSLNLKTKFEILIISKRLLDYINIKKDSNSACIRCISRLVDGLDGIKIYIGASCWGKEEKRKQSH